MSDLAAIYRLSQDDIPGTSLSGKSPDDLNIEQLKRWLACRGTRRSRKKGRACSTVILHVYIHVLSAYSVYYPSVMNAYYRKASKIIANYFDYCRVKEYIHIGLDTNIIDPDEGAIITRKLERLLVSGLNERDHPNLRLLPAIPTEG